MVLLAKVGYHFWLDGDGVNVTLVGQKENRQWTAVTERHLLPDVAHPLPMKELRVLMNIMECLWR